MTNLTFDLLTSSKYPRADRFLASENGHRDNESPRYGGSCLYWFTVMVFVSCFTPSVFRMNDARRELFDAARRSKEYT